MCLAIPCRITEILDDDMCNAQVGESETFITCSLMLLGETPAVDDYVLVHAGFAINVVEREEALRTIELFKEMAKLTGQAPVLNTAHDL